jgi:hypothetical protein
MLALLLSLGRDKVLLLGSRWRVKDRALMLLLLLLFIPPSECTISCDDSDEHGNQDGLHSTSQHLPLSLLILSLLPKT